MAPADAETRAWRPGFWRAFLPGILGRRRADRLGWGVRVVRDLGFPIAVAWYLLAALPARLDHVLERDRELRQEQADAVRDAVREETAALRAQTNALTVHITQQEKLNAVMLDRTRVVIRAVRDRPTTTTVIVQPSGNGATPAPEPKPEQPKPAPHRWWP